MVGKSVILDTNIIIDYLRGYNQAKELFVLYAENKVRVFISIITLIEVLVGISDSETRQKVELWLLDLFSPIQVCVDIARKAVVLRKKFKLLIPDAVIVSTAQCYHGTLVTRDRDFKHVPGVQYPYSLDDRG